MFRLILESLYLILPAYLANMAPVLAKNHFKALAVPIDQNKKWHGKPILGSHKTWRGMVVGVAAGFLAFLLQRHLAVSGVLSITILDYATVPFWTGALMGFGALFGDAVKSFFKRRWEVAPGKPWIPADQLDFIVGALVFLSLVVVLPWQALLTLMIVSPLLHIATNHTAFYLGIRKEKW